MSYNGLKVAFLHPRLEGGGAERVSLTTARLFSKWGIHSTFIGSKHNPNEFVLPEGFNAEIYCLPNQETFYTEDNKAALITYLAEQNIRIAFTCYIEGNFLVDVIETSQCKFVFWNHTNPFWERNYAIELGEMQAAYSLRKKIQWMLLGKRNELHGDEYFERIKLNYLRDIDTFWKYIVLCPGYIDEISQKLCLDTSRGDKMVAMINTIDIDQAPQLLKKKEIIYVGRLSLVQKRFDRLLKVWREIQDKLPDWELSFYGAGPDEWIFHKLVRKYRLKRIHLCGYETDLKRIYNDAAIICMTSSFEGWPMVLVEAQSNGVVPISFDCCAGVESIIGASQCAGRLVKPFDLKAYADTLLELCQNDTLRHNLQQACLTKRLDYAPDINDDRWKKLFDELLISDNCHENSGK